MLRIRLTVEQDQIKTYIVDSLSHFWRDSLLGVRKAILIARNIHERNEALGLVSGVDYSCS